MRIREGGKSSEALQIREGSLTNKFYKRKGEKMREEGGR